MPRVALTKEQKREHKLKSFKGWIKSQMHLNHMNQEDVARALGVSRSYVSQMLKVQDPKKKGKDEKIKPDPFSYGDVLILCELFGVDEEERGKLLMM